MYLHLLLGTLVISISTGVRKLRIIDTHTHLSDISRFHYVDDWCKTSYGINNYTSDNTQSKTVVSTYFIFVQASVIPEENIEEVTWVQNQSEEDPIHIGGIIGYLPLEDGNAIKPALESMLKLPQFRGVRRILETPPNDPCWFLATDFVDGLKLLSDHSLIFELLTRIPEQWSCALDLIRQAPDNLTVVLQHLGGPNMTIRPDPNFDKWKYYISEMAKYKNVVAKVSGVPERAVGSINPFDDWTMENVAPYIDHVTSTFGFDRCVFGGNWFVIKTYSTFMRWVDTLYEHLQTQKVKDKDLDMFFYDNAYKLYRINN